MLILVFVMSGAMLAWPLVQRRFSAVKDVNTIEATQLINRQNAVLLDVREPKAFEGGRDRNRRMSGINRVADRGSCGRSQSGQRCRGTVAIPARHDHPRHCSASLAGSAE